MGARLLEEERLPILGGPGGGVGDSAFWEVRRRREELLGGERPVLHRPRHSQPPAGVNLQVTVHEPDACEEER